MDIIHVAAWCWVFYFVFWFVKTIVFSYIRR